MKKILGGRASGKTRRLIRHAARRNAMIVCPTRGQADYVWRTASNMSVLIPRPCSIADLCSGRQDPMKNELMLDEADTILEMLLCRRFSAATFRDDDVDLMWRRGRPR